MQKKQVLFKTKGMNRDLSVSAFNSEFAFENRNLRLSTNDGNTLLSWVNEKGTRELNFSIVEETVLSILGTPVGKAVIEHKLVLFTHSSNPDTDRIYVIRYDVTKVDIVGTLLYEGNLNFQTSNPLETLVSYESEDIQKVYWTDGINAPRMINVVKNYIGRDATQFDFIRELALNEEVKVQKIHGANGTFAPGVIQYAFTYYVKYGQETNIFYTTPLLYISHKDRGASPEDRVSNAFKIKITNLDMNFNFLRIYSIQRTSLDSTPICKRVQDIALTSVGKDIDTEERRMVSSNSEPVWYKDGVPYNPTGSQWNKVFNFFGIPNVRCYGFSKGVVYCVGADNLKVTFGSASGVNSVLWRTKDPVTYNGVTAYWVFETSSPYGTDYTNVAIVGNVVPEVSFLDTGSMGNIIDPTELLYKGGTDITAYTLEQKDGTLFLGNLGIRRSKIAKSIKTACEDIALTGGTRTIYPTAITTEGYKYASQLTAYDSTDRDNSVPCSGFKVGNYYRCGLQFQYKTGEWSEPVYINDYQITGNNPSISTSGTVSVNLPIIKGELPSGIANTLRLAGYKKLRPIVVFPSINDRAVICQGVPAPTMYTTSREKERQSSYFFRANFTGRPYPSTYADMDKNYGVIPGGFEVGNSNYLYYTQKDINWNPDNIKAVEIEGDYDNDNKFKIDKGIFSLHSPDVEFDYIGINSYSNTFIRECGFSAIANTYGDIDIQTETPTISNLGGGFIHKYCVGENMHGIVAGAYYDDTTLEDDNNEIKKYENQKTACKWIVYPWQGTGSLNNDIKRPSDKGTASAILKKKVISNLRYSNTVTWSNYSSKTLKNDLQLFLSDATDIIKINDIVYRGNVDTSLVPDHSDGKYFVYDQNNVVTVDGSGYFGNTQNAITPFNCDNIWKTFSRNEDQANSEGLYSWYDYYERRYTNTWRREDKAAGEKYLDLVLKKNPVRMKYKSCPHLIARLADNTSLTWNNNTLPVLEVYRDINPNTVFGGKSVDAFKENTWIPCGKPVRLDSLTTHNVGANDEYQSVDFEYSYGDSYFQRYDCLKTYPFTREDINQVVEIGSFMLETYINIDGRYDRNRGQQSNINMSPQNFNLINTVYSQIDNFFSYKMMDEDYYNTSKYPNQITWTKTKESGADIDLWTNITLASTLELDGDKGAIKKLIRLNDQIICFQDTGISRILYNESAQFSTTEGVPVELGNSGKVDGKKYLNNTIGCSNKWSIETTPAGIYFIDSNDKSIYRLGEGLQNISQQFGMNTWCKQNIPSADVIWDPSTFNGFVSYYDKVNQDVLFINSQTALAFSERLGTFTSFYDYGNTPFFANIGDKGVWIRSNGKLWEHCTGEYGKFFGNLRPYSTILVGNPEPMIDKLFTNISFIANIDGDGDTPTLGSFMPFLPFNSLEIWDEYQHGITNLENITGPGSMVHHTGTTSALKRKFRIWNCDIPRDNAPLASDAARKVSRLSVSPNNRIRNTWAYLELKKNLGIADTTGFDYDANYDGYLLPVDNFFKASYKTMISASSGTDVEYNASYKVKLIDAEGQDLTSTLVTIPSLPYIFTQEDKEVINAAIQTYSATVANIFLKKHEGYVETVYMKHLLDVRRTEIHDITLTYFE